MAAATSLSRVTGLLRTAALAAALGVTTLADAYNVANTLPTVLLVLVTGGSLSAVLVPMLAQEQDPERRARLADSLLGLLLVVTAAAALAMALLSPLLARGLALGAQAGPERDELVRVATLFLVLFAPQVLAYGISVHAVAVLNAAGRLVLGSLASVATNLVTLAGIGAYVLLREGQGTQDTRALVVLGVTTTGGVLAMAALQVRGARRVLPGTRRLPRPRRDESTARALALGRWTVLYVVSNQVGLLVVLTVAASDPGGASAYQWAFAVMQLPYAVVAVSAISALYPGMSRSGREDPVALGAQLSTGLRALLVLMVPAVLVLVLVSAPVTRVLLGYGAVDEAAVQLIGTCVAVFGLALAPFTAFQLLCRACYARSDARSPALVNVAVNAVNVAGALASATVPGLSRQEQAAALVGAYALSYLVGTVLLARRLRRDVPGAVAGLLSSAVRVLPAAAALSAVLVVLGDALVQPGDGAWATALGTAVVLGVGLACYAGVLRLCARSELAALSRWG